MFYLLVTAFFSMKVLTLSVFKNENDIKLVQEIQSLTLLQCICRCEDHLHTKYAHFLVVNPTSAGTEFSGSLMDHFKEEKSCIISIGTIIQELSGSSWV